MLLVPDLVMDIDHAACGTAELGVGTAGHPPENSLDGLERDIDCGALTAHLLAEEAVVVIAAVQRNVVKKCRAGR